MLPSREEGMGSVLLEAMNAGVPITAAAAGGITDVIKNEKTGLLVPRENSESLAAAQLRIMDRPELAKSLTAEARARLPDFSSVKMAQDTLKIYEDAAENFKSH